ncbi:MAG: iron-sulfur cluster assembly protein [Rickettsiales bacterium]|jgi:FeS assembly SUF system protein|nr:iron-sulfur cluster assembly protein [Rickettsiales bacterium]
MNYTKEDIIAALKTVYDPEIPVNIWDLGLVYDINITQGHVTVTMTFTSPTCPMMEELLAMVVSATESATGANNVTVELVWDPPWDIARMSEEARLELDLTEAGW